MICPKCKKKITEKSLKCGYCGAKIATFCKKCHTYNSIYNLKCVNCSEELLKICPSCKSVNFPNAPKCRKCGESFVKKETSKDFSQPDIVQQKEIESEEIISPKAEKEKEEKREEVPLINYDTNFYSQLQAKELVLKAFEADEKKIISINGPRGVGKSVVLKSTIQELKSMKLIWVFGECTHLSQLSPFGLIQDVLLSFFNVTNFCSDSLKLKKDSQRFFQSEFPELTNDEIFNLLNFLYPTNADYFENILINKKKTFSFLKKVFKTIFNSNKTVLIVENFDLIDGLSYEFLHTMFNDSSFAKPFKMIITYSEIRPARGYLYSETLSGENYVDISLHAFDKNQVNSFIDQYFQDKKCPQALKDEMYKYSAGNPAVLEQYVFYSLEMANKMNSLDISLPSSFAEVVKYRLEFLKQNPAAYKILSLAVILGAKFHPGILNQVLKFGDAVFEEALKALQDLNFIIRVNEFAYSFKNSLLWDALFNATKEDEDFSSLNENLFAVCANYTLSSNSMMAIIAQNLNQALSALNIWTDNAKIASYIGDTNLYAISQKQCLVLIEKLEGINTSIIKNNIYERLGKLLAKSNPSEAISYLPDAIRNARKLQDLYKEIELTGYLANCCIALGDYYGTIECIDTTIEKLDSGYELEIAMLKQRKLSSLLNIGNSGEIVNLADNEILPVFDKYLGAKPHKNISIKTLYKAWLSTYLALANALTIQGDSRAFEVISTLFEIIEKNNFDEKLFICKAKLTLAFANTIKGDIEASENILSEVIKTYKTDIMDNEAISKWNLINILNNFLHKKYSGLKEELFQVVTFANNTNDNFTKNILKTLLGKIFKDEENAKRALEIYSEQVTYFAKQKNAIGALLTWYLIAEANLVAEGPEKAIDVAQKALEVAQGPKINNYLFIVLYNKVLAESYMAQSEYELAKVHIEKGILVARKFELLHFLSDLYLLYGKYLQDIALIKTDAQVDYVMGAAKMYKKAGLIAQGIKNAYLISKIDKAKTVLSSFCQLNGITLKDV